MLYNKRWDAKVEENETVRILKAAREVISSPDHWCQGEYAVTADGQVSVSVVNPGSDKFCMIGAIASVTKQPISQVEGGEAVAALRLATGTDPDRLLHQFNDSSTHTDVLAAFDRAIAARS